MAHSRRGLLVAGAAMLVLALLSVDMVAAFMGRSLPSLLDLTS